MTLPMFEHQKKGVEFIISKGGSGALFMEIGTGKTRTAIEIFNKIRESNPHIRMLVVAPISLLEAAWAEDVKKFSDFSVWNIRNGWGDLGRIAEDIFLVNYEFLLSKDKLTTLLRKLKSGFDWMIVLDESSRIKNAQSKTTKILLAMAKLFKYRIVMSGTPAPNSEMEYWPQMQFVAPGCLGTSMTAFRSHFFHLVNRYTKQVVTPTFISRLQAADIFRKCDYQITNEKRNELMKFIMPHCYLAKKKDCLDLPDQVDEIRLVEMEDSQKKAYFEMKRHLVVQIQEQQIAAPLALTKLMKLRQITSGFIYNEEGDSYEINLEHDNHFKMSLETKMPFVKNEPGEEDFWGDAFNPLEKEFSNPKLKELFDNIEEAGNQPIIIWIQFHWEQIKICHELHKRFGENQVVTLSALTKDKDGSIKAFLSGSARFLVAHPASAAHGLTFVNCSLEIFFSLDWSSEKHEQARGRIHRPGQTKKCTYVYLLCKDTIDEDILAVLRGKHDEQEVLYKMMEDK